MRILGLNAFHGDASAALLIDGQLVCAVEEERLNRVKHCAGFPSLAVRECLRLGGISAGQLDHVAISRDPRAHLADKLLHVGTRLLHSRDLPALVRQVRDRLTNRKKITSVESALADALGTDELRATFHTVEHHRAHLASAFFASGFAEAAVLSLDGFGDFVSTMWGRGTDRHIEVLGEVGFPHSLGALYTAMTQWLGFPKYGDEGKVMGLAAYGNAQAVPELRQLLQLHPDGSFSLELRYFRHHRDGIEMSWADGSPKLARLYGDELCRLLGPAREPGSALLPRHQDVAASLQALLEDAVCHLALGVQRRTGLTKLTLAGGVALNSVANGKILDRTPFAELFVQPAAGDNGTAIGAALWIEHQVLGRPRRFVMHHAYTGPTFSLDECTQAVQSMFGAAASLDAHGQAVVSGVATVGSNGQPSQARLRIERLSDSQLRERAVSAIERGEVIGWFQGAMEFGPRALGHRSILADPRRADMKDILNRRIKHREPFRPFAPAILAEHTAQWFVRAAPSPAMLLVDEVRKEKRALVPAIVHADGTGRLQTVEQAHSPHFYALIAAFAERTGVPILLNTSFNEHEPIVCSPSDALRCFVKTHMDALALCNLWLSWVIEVSEAEFHYGNTSIDAG